MSAAEIISNTVAGIALALSAVAFFRTYFHNRVADVSIWFGITADGKGKSDRLVLVNHGPAIAKDIAVTFYNESGELWELRTTSGTPFPVSILSPGDQIYIPIFVVLGTGDYVRAHLTWNDGRCRRQTRETTQSLTGVPVGAPTPTITVRRR